MADDSFTLTKHEILWILSIVIVTFCIVILISLMNSGISRDLDVTDLQQHVLKQRIISSKDCLAYDDKRTNLGIIDFDKFNTERIENCLDVDNLGMKLTLKIDEEVNELKINQDLVSKEPFCKKENFRCSQSRYYVLTEKNGELKGSYLDINMVGLI